MKGVRDWFFSQLLSNSLASSGPLSSGRSFFHGGSPDEEFDDRGISFPLPLYFKLNFIFLV